MRRLFILLFTLLHLGLTQAQDAVVLQYATSIDRGYGDANSVVTPYTTFTPQRLELYAGASITHVRIGLQAKASGVYIYFKRNATDATPLYRQKVGDLDEGWNDILLDTPFAITGSDTICIGYKASFRAAEGAGYDRHPSPEGSIVYNNARTRWDDIQGSFCIQAIIMGDNLPSDELALIHLQDATLPIGADSTLMTAIVENRGCNEVTTYQLQYHIEQCDLLCRHYATRLLPSQRDTVTITVPSQGIGSHQVFAHIASVNGNADSYAADDSAQAILFEPDPSMLRRVVIEEATGEWCGWCPRGLVGLEMMKQRHPHDFIAISVHGGDEFETDDYLPFLSNVEVFPSCSANRRYSGDPYEDIEQLFTREAMVQNHLSYTLTATIDESGIIHTHSQMLTDKELVSQHLNLAIVVTEDQVLGAYQNNSYAGSSVPMGGWESLPSIVYPVYYDDVARGIFPDYSGQHFLSGNIIPGTTYVQDIDFRMPASVANPDNTHIIGLLLDATTGFVLNAFSATLSAASSLDAITAPPSISTTAYDLLGRPVKSSPHGNNTHLYIVGQGITLIQQ